MLFNSGPLDKFITTEAMQVTSGSPTPKAPAAESECSDHDEGLEEEEEEPVPGDDAEVTSPAELADDIQGEPELADDIQGRPVAATEQYLYGFCSASVMPWRAKLLDGIAQEKEKPHRIRSDPSTPGEFIAVWPDGHEARIVDANEKQREMLLQTIIAQCASVDGASLPATGGGGGRRVVVGGWWCWWVVIWWRFRCCGPFELRAAGP